MRNSQQEISAEKRRRRLRSLALLLAAMGLYAGYRAWSFSRYRAALEKNLSARLQEREREEAAYLVRCEEKMQAEIQATGEPERELPLPLPTLAQLLGKKDPALLQTDLANLFERIRAEAATAYVRPGSQKVPAGEHLLDVPTFYLTEYHEPFFGLGAWEFLRHLPDKQGNVLLYFPGAGFREAPVVDGGEEIRRLLKTYDRVLSLDLPKERGDWPCGPVPPGYLAARRAVAILHQIEKEAGGPSRFLAVRSEGHEAGLLAALIEKRIVQVELLGTAADQETSARLAVLLLLLRDRALLVDESALNASDLASLKTLLSFLGDSAALTVQPTGE